jgi:hypothetical protein
MKTPDQPAHPLTRDQTHLNAAPAELIGLRAALTAEREKSERYRLATLKLDADLAAERARLDWVFGNCKVEADDFTTGNRDVYAIHDREDLRAAMKENAT